MMNKTKNHYTKTLILVLATWCAGFVAHAQVYDIVLKGGRVMDPETGLDAIRNVGITGDRIAAISEADLVGKTVLDVSGHVVAPGFIDLHVHGMTNDAHRYQARDGVTTALELEGGLPFFAKAMAEKEGKTLVNYGASAAQANLRAMAMRGYAPYVAQIKAILAKPEYDQTELDKIAINMGRAAYQAMDDAEIKDMMGLLEAELEAGALGIGVPVGYYPGSTRGEIYRVYELAAQKNVLVYSHTRGFGLPGIQEALANAAAAGAPLHIVHLNSLSLGEIDVALDMIASAQQQGINVTTELYPYTAASTSLESALFDEGWQESLQITYGDLQWEATGERLTEQTFQEYRKKGGIVIIHMMKPEWISKGIASPVTMIASDGMPYAPGAHPRTAGTFSRVLGKYVREEQTIGLMEALAKMTLMPAKRMELVAPAMRGKGRLQVGADADITVFDPNKITDKATFKGLEYSEGIPYVLVNGTAVVREGELVEGVFPGKAVMGKYKR
ncbi:MAG: amidohydrolase family protein [Saprospiraceae bacterium]|nr:amidohydrolase family protein [Saprospiraceae bacterium]